MRGKAAEYISGGVQHNLSFNHPFPLVFTKAERVYLYDIDGNKVGAAKLASEYSEDVLSLLF